MKQLFAFVRKEFYHVLRDRKTLLILFGMPVVQILIFGFALTNEIKNSEIAVMDPSHDEQTTSLITRIHASRYFDVRQMISPGMSIDSIFREGHIKMALVFPENFKEKLSHDRTATIQVLCDATDPNTANLLLTYVSAIVGDYQTELNPGRVMPLRINTEVRMLYNPQLKGVHNFVPGVMSLVLMLVCVMMTAVAIVREKELGTMEVLLVSPFQPVMVLVSKAIPYLILSLVNVAMILLLSVQVLELPINGSLFLIFAESTLFIITCLSIGLLISVRTQTQQAAMMISFVGMLLPTLLFSGFMFPIENMPKPLQFISNLVPAKWFYIIIKSVMIKGLSLRAILKPTLILCGMTVVLLVISLKNFKIRLA